MNSDMRLVFLATEFPFPPRSGAKLRNESILHLLSEWVSVEILYLKGDAQTPTWNPSHSIQFKKLKDTPAPWFRKIISPFRPYFINGYRPEIEKALRDRMAPEAILWLSGLGMAQYARLGRKLGYRVILDEFNIESSVYAELILASKVSGIRRAWHSIYLRSMKHHEAKLVELCDDTVVVSQEDEQRLTQICKPRRIWVLPNLIHVDRYMKKPPPARIEGRLNSPFRILFIGTLDYEPNRQGILWFLQEVLPKIQLKTAPIQILIAGARANAQLRRIFQGNPSIEFIDEPEDLDSIWQRADLFIVPLFSGGGSRLKILEALASEIPLVSTTKGAEGIPNLHPGVHYRLANTPQEFAHAIQMIAENPTDAAWEFSKSPFDWSEGKEVIRNLLFESSPKKDASSLESDGRA